MTDEGLRRLGSGTERTAKEIADQLRVAFQRPARRDLFAEPVLPEPAASPSPR